MNDGFAWWLVVLGIAIGVGLVWLFLVKLPRTESDVDDSELVAEAGWISHSIETYGGVAPLPLVEEILELHRQYLTRGVPAPDHVSGEGLVEAEELPRAPTMPATPTTTPPEPAEPAGSSPSRPAGPADGRSV
jgi:hypothetical protein